jgi:peptide/nickel transport system substrate-binding protein
LEALTPMQVSRQLDSSFKNNFEILNRPSFGFTYLGFNLENPKFKDIKVRQALSLAINRQELS